MVLFDGVVCGSVKMFITVSERCEDSEMFGGGAVCGLEKIYGVEKMGYGGWKRR